jgi:hypothetical protein
MLSFKSFYRGVCIDANNEKVTELSCFDERLEVAKMKEVEATIGKTNLFAMSLGLVDNGKEL